jgi:hypothetical protein
MRSIIAVLSLGLVLGVQPAAAQVEHALTISVHPNVRPRLTESNVEDILERASKLLKIRNGCNVGFKLKGPIKRFAQGTPENITNESELEKVHEEAADVKVVSSISFCKKDGDFIGCAWRRQGPKTIIVTQQMLVVQHILWTHEFGHTTGLQHRTGAEALMTACNLNLTDVEITPKECDCFRAGPGGCNIPEPNPEIKCGTNQDN